MSEEKRKGLGGRALIVVLLAVIALVIFFGSGGGFDGGFEYSVTDGQGAATDRNGGAFAKQPATASEQREADKARTRAEATRKADFEPSQSVAPPVHKEWDSNSGSNSAETWSDRVGQQMQDARGSAVQSAGGGSSGAGGSATELKQIPNGIGK